MFPTDSAGVIRNRPGRPDQTIESLVYKLSDKCDRLATSLYYTLITLSKHQVQRFSEIFGNKILCELLGVPKAGKRVSSRFYCFLSGYRARVFGSARLGLVFLEDPVSGSDFTNRRKSRARILKHNGGLCISTSPGFYHSRPLFSLLFATFFDPGGGGVLPYIRYIGMCRPIG